MPEWLSHIPLLEEALTFIFGGGVFETGRRLWKTYASSSRKADTLQAELGRKMRDELKGMLNEERSARKALEKRVEDLEDRLDDEKERRVQAERSEEALNRKLNIVISLFNDLREEQGKPRLSGKEITLLAIDSKRNGSKS